MLRPPRPKMAVLLLASLTACERPVAHVDVTEEVRATLESCQTNAADKRACVRGRLLDILRSADVGAALDVLEGVTAADVDVRRDAHVYAHAIGVNAYSHGDSFHGVFAQCSELFQSGCYHGVIQAYFMEQGNNGREAVRDLCTAYDSNAQRWLFFQCLHGLGHALTMLYDHRLPDALEGCDLLGTDWEEESCYGGAFMENIVSVTEPHHAASVMTSVDAADNASADEDAHGAVGTEAWEALRASDPHYPCSVLAERYMRACYMMQTSAMLWHNGWDVADAAKSCGQAPERWRTTCFQSLGRDLSSLTLQEPDESVRQCQNVPDDYREWCYVGLVKNFVDLSGTTEAGFDLCTRVEDFARPRCNEALGEEIWSLEATENGRRAACAAAETGGLRLSCLRGARVEGS